MDERTHRTGAAAQPRWPDVKQRRSDPRALLRCGDVTINLAARTVDVGGHAVDLSYTAFELLCHFCINKGRVVTRDEIVGSHPPGGQLPRSLRAVDIRVARLRQKLAAAHRCRIVTVRSVGYRCEEQADPPHAR